MAARIHRYAEAVGGARHVAGPAEEQVMVRVCGGGGERGDVPGVVGANAGEDDVAVALDGGDESLGLAGMVHHRVLRR